MPETLIRRQLTLILDSAEFTASKRASHFLKFVCEAALEGRTDIEQSEIASALLDRGEDFNPVEDASVRKLATLTRQRLDAYYAGPGKDDPVVILVPPRSYVPRFRLRGNALLPEVVPGSRRRAWPWVLAVAVLLLVPGAAVWLWKRPAAPAGGTYLLTAHKGEIMAQRNDAKPDAIRVGGAVGTTETVVARMTFTPNQDFEQAGIMIFQDADNYVKLGRCMLRRTQFEFTSEQAGSYRRSYPSSFTYDAVGQTGEPVWLAIRRNGEEFRAYTSLDGRRWQRIGEIQRVKLSTSNTRVAVFAFADNEAARPSLARFEHVGINPPVPDWDGEGPDLAKLDIWKEENACADGARNSTPDLLEWSFPDAAQRCSWDLRRPVPTGDWDLTAIVDGLTWSRAFVGIQVFGDKAVVNLVRSNSNGGTISLMKGPEYVAQRRDLPGSPPIALRVRAMSGVLTASAGRTLDTLEPFGRIALRDVGSHLRSGVRVGRGAKHDETMLAPAGIRWVSAEQLSLHNFRQ